MTDLKAVILRIMLLRFHPEMAPARRALILQQLQGNGYHV